MCVLGGCLGLTEHLILLPLLPKCCDYRHGPPPAGLWGKGEATWLRKFRFPCFHGVEKGHASLAYQCPSRSLPELPLTPIGPSPKFWFSLEPCLRETSQQKRASPGDRQPSHRPAGRAGKGLKGHHANLESNLITGLSWCGGSEVRGQR